MKKKHHLLLKLIKIIYKMVFITCDVKYLVENMFVQIKFLIQNNENNNLKHKKRIIIITNIFEKVLINYFVFCI